MVHSAGSDSMLWSAEQNLVYRCGKKIQLYGLPHSQNNVQNIWSYQKLCNPRWGPAGRWDLAGPPNVLCWPSVSFPPHVFTCPICEESYIYWGKGNNGSIRRVAVTLSRDTLVLTTSSSSSSSTSSPFFFLPWERVCWTFWDCHYASFPTRSLGFLQLFSIYYLLYISLYIFTFLLVSVSFLYSINIQFKYFFQQPSVQQQLFSHCSNYIRL